VGTLPRLYPKICRLSKAAATNCWGTAGEPLGNRWGTAGVRPCVFDVLGPQKNASLNPIFKTSKMQGLTPVLPKTSKTQGLTPVFYPGFLEELEHHGHGDHGAQGGSQVGENHHQQNAGHVVAPEPFEGHDVFGDGFQVPDLGLAGERLHQA
jgi:hypothetical protein